jgi:hypothetical protein
MQGLSKWGMAVAASATALLLAGAARAQSNRIDDVVPPPSGDIGAGDLGTQRELSGAEIRLDPPRLVGEATDLRVENGHLTGTIEGRGYSADVTSDRVVGKGPIGKIDLAVTTQAGEVHFDGTWNGQPLHTVVTKDGVRGHVRRMARPGSVAVQSCELKIDRPKGNVINGLGQCLGGTEPLRFSVKTPGPMTLVNPDAALLLTAYLAGPPQGPPRQRP